ncbi:MAG: flagellar motor switch protein FliN [Holosporales bacterium]|jgi:flagellar motor switch protein FliN/FliY|nr:flagellar motor switch protein FliN [Holosporales bacterium]
MIKSQKLDLRDLQEIDSKELSEKGEEKNLSRELQSSQEMLDLKTVYDIPVKVSAVLGRASMHVRQFLELSRGSVVTLDRCVGDPIDIYVNDRLVARGEVVVVDQSLGISMTELVKSGADFL